MPAQGTQHIRTLEGNILTLEIPTPSDEFPSGVDDDHVLAGPVTVNGVEGNDDPFVVNAVPSIGGPQIEARADGTTHLFAQSASAILGVISLVAVGDILLVAPRVIGFGPAANVVISPGGYLNLEGLGEVPADEEIGIAGHGAYAAIWFDRTHGATKLMCKARDIDGQIVTGTICTLT